MSQNWGHPISPEDPQQDILQQREQQYQEYQQQYQQGAYYGAPSGQVMEWQEIWQKALFNPSVETFQEIISISNATTARATVWILVYGCVYGVANFFSQLIWGNWINEFLFPNLPTTEPNIIVLMVNIPVTVISSLIGFFISIGIVYVSARVFGGTGDFDKHLFAAASYVAPIGLITSLLLFVPIVGFVILIPLSIYAFVLNVISTKAVHGFGWFNAVAAVLLVPVLIGLAVGCCLVFFVAALAGS